MQEHIIERSVVPFVPAAAATINKEKYNIFAPLAAPGKVGMAAFNLAQFVLQGSVVSLRLDYLHDVIDNRIDGALPDVESSTPYDDAVTVDEGATVTFTDDYSEGYNDGYKEGSKSGGASGGTSVTIDGEVQEIFHADTYIAARLAELVNGAPATLDTLAKIATALGDDPNFATTILTELGEKVAKSNGINHVYATDGNGNTLHLTWAQGVSGGTLVRRDLQGHIYLADAASDNQAVSLGQMNAAIGDISAALDEVHAYAEAIKGGATA